MESQNIINSLNMLSEKIIKNIDDKVYKLLDDIMRIDEKILKVEPLKLILKINNIELIQTLARSLIMIFTICFILKQLIAIYNGSKCENVFLYLTKILVISILVTNGYWFCEQILNLFGMITDCVDKIIEFMINKPATFNNLKGIILSVDDLMKNDALSIDGLIKGMISFGIINVLISFSVRYVKVIFLILTAPFSFMFLASDSTRGIFETWFKLIITNLSVQVFIKFIILIPLAVTDKKGMLFKVILLGTIYIIFKLNDLVNHIMANISIFSSNKEKL